MTTLVALASQHALVMGSDSLGTVSKRLVDPMSLIDYFDTENEFKLKVDAQGQPLLNGFFDVFNKAENVPYNQLLHVTKLFGFPTMPVGIMFTGITSIGSESVRGLVTDFLRSEATSYSKSPNTFDIGAVAQSLFDAVREKYKKVFTSELNQPGLELLLGGYSASKNAPTLYRLQIDQDKCAQEFSDDNPFGVAFAGQMDWIQRIVFGTDVRNQIKIRTRVMELLEKYRGLIDVELAKNGLNYELPLPSTFGSDLEPFEGWSLDRLDANWSEFSEQNSIDSVQFFLDIMIRAQDVSSQLPTVGGQTHVAVIRHDGYHQVSREVWTHLDHAVEIPEVRNDRR